MLVRKPAHTLRDSFDLIFLCFATSVISFMEPRKTWGLIQGSRCPDMTVDLTDVTLTDEDTNSTLTDEDTYYIRANRALVAKFTSNASGANHCIG